MRTIMNMKTKNMDASALISTLTEEAQKELLECCCAEPFICKRPNHAKPQNEDAFGGMTRFRVEQYGPGMLGDDFYGNVYARIKNIWVCVPFNC